MNKEQFIKLMSLIQNFQSEQETLQVLISKLTDSYPIVTIGNNLIDGIINILTNILKLKDKDLLSWWLYENVDKVIYEGEYGENKISVRTLEELYNYITMDN